MRILIFLSFLFIITKQDQKMSLLDSLLIEIPHYDEKFLSYKCNNITFYKQQGYDPILIKWLNYQLINFTLEKFKRIDVNKYLSDIKKNTVGWNTSSYLGQFDSQYDYIFQRDIGQIKNPSIDPFYHLELSFNILIIDQTYKTEISPDNFIADFYSDKMINRAYDDQAQYHPS